MRPSARMFSAGPQLCAYIPVMRANRDGAHTGALANAFWYRTPCAASASMAGVRARVSPYAPMNGLLSSLTSHRMLGRPVGAAGPAAGAAAGAVCAACAVELASRVASTTVVSRPGSRDATTAPAPTVSTVRRLASYPAISALRSRDERQYRAVRLIRRIAVTGG